MWKYMNIEINPDELPTQQELLERLDGGTDADLAKLREEHYAKYGVELIWRYPISEGASAGGFILPVREGILWIPYDTMMEDLGEVLILEDAQLLDAETCIAMADDFQSFANALCDVLREAAAICEEFHCGGEHIENSVL